MLKRAPEGTLDRMIETVNMMEEGNWNEEEMEAMVEELLIGEGHGVPSQGHESLIREGLKRVKPFDGKRNWKGWAQEFERLTGRAISQSGMIHLALQCMTEEVKDIANGTTERYEWTKWVQEMASCFDHGNSERETKAKIYDLRQNRGESATVWYSRYLAGCRAELHV